MGLSAEHKIHMAVYSGCDYLENVKGLGFGTVIDYFPNKQKDLLKKIKLQGKKSIYSNTKIFPEGIESFDEYITSFKQVVESFEH